MIYGIQGKAGSGKDTVGEMLARELGGITIAFADPIKRFGTAVFGFTDNQLWGPSELRNGVDELGRDLDYWAETTRKLDDYGAAAPGKEVKTWLRQTGLQGHEQALLDWFNGVMKECLQDPSKFTPRHVLQTLGTEFGRLVEPNVWVRNGIETAERLLEGVCAYSRAKGIVATPGLNVNAVVITDTRFRNEVIGIRKAGGSCWRVVNPAKGAGLDGAAGAHQSETESDSMPDWWFSRVIINDKEKGLASLAREVHYAVSEGNS